MPDQNQTNTTPITATPPPKVDDVIVSPDMPAPEPEVDETSEEEKEDGNIKEVASKIQNVHNILVALSSDPSVDEIAAAIGLSLCLDRAGKRVTSIYSGQTPNILEFLHPEKTFEVTSDVLRDFVISLNKDKADHLRYKLDGDYVKIFITPYKTHIDEEDLEFSLGDFNIELVLALNVESGVDLDDALREHGRVMHDAAVINITNGNPGKFGDIEWSDKTKSSICEMVASLLYELGGKDALQPNEATALLTGIIAATDHFSNNSTTAEALQISAKLIESGADRELISENIDLDAQNMFFQSPNKEPSSSDNTLDINHEDPSATSEEIYIDPDAPEKPEPETKTSPKDKILGETNPEEDTKNSEPLPDLQQVANDLAEAETAIKPPEETPESNDEPSANTENSNTEEETVSSSEIADEEPKGEKIINPSAEFISGADSTLTGKYSQMLEDAISDPTQTAPIDTTPAYAPDATTAPAPITPPTSPIPETQNNPIPEIPAGPTPPAMQPTVPVASTPEVPVNPALSAAPPVASSPEINGVPNINYMPMPDENILPPPPAPPIDFGQSTPSI